MLSVDPPVLEAFVVEVGDGSRALPRLATVRALGDNDRHHTTVEEAVEAGGIEPPASSFHQRRRIS